MCASVAFCSSLARVLNRFIHSAKLNSNRVAALPTRHSCAQHYGPPLSWLPNRSSECLSTVLELVPMSSELFAVWAYNTTQGRLPQLRSDSAVVHLWYETKVHASIRVRTTWAHLHKGYACSRRCAARVRSLKCMGSIKLRRWLRCK